MDATAIAKIENCSAWVSINNVALPLYAIIPFANHIRIVARTIVQKRARQKKNDNNYPAFIGDLLHIIYL